MPNERKFTFEDWEAEYIARIIITGVYDIDHDANLKEDNKKYEMISKLVMTQHPDVLSKIFSILYAKKEVE